MNENDLITALRHNNENAFRFLVDRYQKSVFNIALGFVQQKENAEEVTQEVFIKVFETIAGFKQDAKLSTWVYRIAVNQSLDFIRHTKRKKRFAIITSMFNKADELIHQPPDFCHPGVVLENKEQATVLFKAIAQLPQSQKTAFLLQKIDGCSQQKIAAIMQLTEGAVESHLFRAKATLKKLLINYYQA
ncbi:RNA polymerase sigma factor [Mucilaginibacter psychrotolerans]|uniref:RNA polymerase sigma factor n=1 Tax=Mucilaginibacter psychrotolerans TaxID=1524096 RepID=A0A4Y8SAV1_9SPHI|nr:RNA polymerase sigma factor [Mucilaginibacter psychrotolerans]TFF35750.1 RNA polymerase sigma factor [Mucilaginibacter psychrotolerans]